MDPKEAKQLASLRKLGRNILSKVDAELPEEMKRLVAKLDEEQEHDPAAATKPDDEEPTS